MKVIMLKLDVIGIFEDGFKYTVPVGETSLFMLSVPDLSERYSETSNNLNTSRIANGFL